MTINEKTKIGSPLAGDVPDGPVEKRWITYKDHLSLVSPANKKKHHILVIGTGLAGASAAASLAELGYNIKSFCIQDSPRRAL